VGELVATNRLNRVVVEGHSHQLPSTRQSLDFFVYSRSDSICKSKTMSNQRMESFPRKLTIRDSWLNLSKG